MFALWRFLGQTYQISTDAQRGVRLTLYHLAEAWRNFPLRRLG